MSSLRLEKTLARGEMRSKGVFKYKYLAIHIHESARQRARELVNTPAFAQHNSRERKWKPYLRNSRIRSGCDACAYGA